MGSRWTRVYVQPSEVVHRPQTEVGGEGHDTLTSSSTGVGTERTFQGSVEGSLTTEKVFLQGRRDLSLGGINGREGRIPTVSFMSYGSLYT